VAHKGTFIFVCGINIKAEWVVARSGLEYSWDWRRDVNFGNVRAGVKANSLSSRNVVWILSRSLIVLFLEVASVDTVVGELCSRRTVWEQTHRSHESGAGPARSTEGDLDYLANIFSSLSIGEMVVGAEVPAEGLSRDEIVIARKLAARNVARCLFRPAVVMV